MEAGSHSLAKKNPSSDPFNNSSSHRLLHSVNTDEKIQDIAVAMIRRHSMNPEEWRFTSIGKLHPGIEQHFELLAGELMLVSAFFSDDSWYAFTTRRIITNYAGCVDTLDPQQGVNSEFGNFKGYPLDNNTQLGAIPRATASLKNPISVLHFEYETGKASMAPIYATQYWCRKHPILHKLLTRAEHESYTSRNAK